MRCGRPTQIISSCHTEVSKLALTSLPLSISSAEIRLWNLPTRSLLQSIPRAHDSVIQSLCISPLTFSPSPSGLGTKRLLSCGTDRTIKLWDANPDNGRIEVPEEGNDEDGTLGWLKEKEVDRTEVSPSEMKLAEDT